MRRISRKDFIRLSLTFVGVAATGSLAVACSDPVEPSQPRRDVPPGGGIGGGGDGDGGVEPPPEDSKCDKDLKLEGDKISDNHNHTLEIPKDDIEAATAKTYDIQGTGDHPHELEISADQFKRIKDGEEVEVTSQNVNGHTHKVKIKCG